MINLKKGLAALILSVLAIPTFAQSDSNSFDPYWYLGVQGGVGLTIGETSYSSLLSPAAALSVGYQFTPVFGMRLNGTGWQSKGSIVTLDETYKYNYIQGNLDFMFDVCSIFAGYNADRVFNPYLFAGVGYNYGFNNDEAVDYSNAGYDLAYIWEDSQSLFAGRVGVGADFKVSDRVSLGLEYNVNGLSDKYNSKEAGNLDWHHNLLLGVKIKLGDNGKKAAAAAAAAAAAKAAAEAEAAAKAAAAKAAAEAAAKAAAEKAAAEKAAAEAAAKAAAAKEAAAKAPRNVFFMLDSSDLTAEGTARVNEIVALMKEYPTRNIALTGYADEETGNAKYNMNLSAERAATVKAALIEKGISESRISTDYKGDTVRPYSETEKNRVVIALLQ